MIKRFFIVLGMLLLLSACKKNKENIVPYTTFEAEVKEKGTVKFIPSDGEGTQVWDFGDGSSVFQGTAGSPVWHCYAKNGNYSVKLTVQSPLGGKKEFSSTVKVSNVPQRAFIKKFEINALNDPSVDPDTSGSDVVFVVKRYAENSTDVLYKSPEFTNINAANLPLNITLNNSARVEFPVSGYLVSVAMEDDNSGTIYPNDILCYMAWYDGLLRPTQGVSWINENNKPNYYPETISRTQYGNEMNMMLDWEN